MATKCRHCGSSSYGHGCAYGPDRLHEHRDDEKHCEWCGSSSYGHGCAYGPNRLHRHGPGGNKCIWCGSTSSHEFVSAADLPRFIDACCT